MVRKRIEVEAKVCDFCGYQNIGGFHVFLIVDKCIKCGKDFCPKCGEFGAKGQYICNKCKKKE